MVEVAVKVHPVAKLLADQRRACGLSVDDIADRTGYCHSLIEKLECGQRSPSFAALNAWAETLGFELTLKRKSEA